MSVEAVETVAASPRAEWTDLRAQQLEAMWAKGLTTNEIRDAFECEGFVVTRNAVIGKAHRLGLTEHVLAPKFKAGIKMVTPSKGDDTDTGEDKRAFVAPNGVIWPGPRFCCWPVGDPLEPGFRFCREPKKKGHDNYCPTHARKGVSYGEAPA